MQTEPGSQFRPLDTPQGAAWGKLLAWLIAFAAMLSPRPALYGEGTRPAFAPTTRPFLLSATPRDPGELRAFQTQVEQVVKQVMPAVVAVVVGGTSQGSGVIVSKDGLILTAAHVEADAKRDVWVIFPDGKRVKGKTLGMDRPADGGMVQITDKGDWPVVEVGNSSSLKIGQWCIALGHPGGYQRGRTPPVRLGRIIVARGDTIMSSCTLVSGDSGGPLFDLEGRLIGIHSRIGAPTAFNLHVPVDVFTRSWGRMARGEVWGDVPGFAGGVVMGVQLRDREDRVEVESVVAGSAAEKAGMREGDVIRKFDGRVARTRDELAIFIASHKPGDNVAVEVERGKEIVLVSVKLQAKL
jgi:serine protease Do